MSAETFRGFLGERFEQALVYACHVHGGQFRKGTEVPYVSHLLAVASLVLEDGGDEDQAVAALLHDAAEDQGGRERLNDIAGRFGDRVAKIVEACTDTLEDPKPAWSERKTRFLGRVPSETDGGVLRVEVADKLHNARSIVRDLRELGLELEDRFTPDLDQLLWYYRGLADAFKDSQFSSPMVDDLQEAVTELERLAGLTQGNETKPEAAAKDDRSSLEKMFHRAMIGIYENAKSETGYVATRFLQMVTELGGLGAAKRLLQLATPSDGWTALWERGRLDLTVECLVLKPQFRALFTDQELNIARKWLSDYGYDPEECAS